MLRNVLFWKFVKDSYPDPVMDTLRKLYHDVSFLVKNNMLIKKNQLSGSKTNPIYPWILVA